MDPLSWAAVCTFLVCVLAMAAMALIPDRYDDLGD